MRKTTDRFSVEVRECAVRTVLDNEGQQGSRWQGITSIAAKIGSSASTLNDWVNWAGIDGGKRTGMPGDMAERSTALERENREPRQVNEILREARACLAMAELDRRSM